MGKTKLHTQNYECGTKQSTQKRRNEFSHSDEFAKFINSKKYQNLFNDIGIHSNDIEDVSQNLLLSFCQSKAYDHSRNNLNSFLKVAIRNKKVDYIRRKLKKKNIKNTCEINNESSKDYRKNTYDHKSVLDSIVYEEENNIKKKIFYDAISYVPKKYIQILLDIYRYNNNYKLYAESINKPTGTVKAHVFRAKQKIKEILSSAGYEIKDI